MTDHGSLRRTLVLVAAWIAAAVVAGVPAAAGDADRAEPRARAVPVVQNTGPECFAGKAVAPSPAKDR
jgi:hypothetical protein